MSFLVAYRATLLVLKSRQGLWGFLVREVKKDHFSYKKFTRGEIEPPK